MPEPSDYLSASAILCERTLTEKDSNIISAIRMMDVVSMELPPSQTNIGTLALLPPVQTNLIVVFKSEKPRRFTTHLRGLRPNKEEFASGEYPVELAGGAHGHCILLPISFEAKFPGIYWFEVWVDGNLLQRIPLFVKHTTTAQPGSSTQTEVLSS